MEYFDSIDSIDHIRATASLLIATANLRTLTAKLITVALLRPFFGEMARFNAEGPSLVMELEGPNAIEQWRVVIGPSGWETEYSAQGQGLRSR